MKRYCDACRHYCDEAAMFCPTCGQYTVATEVERIAPEGDVIYPFAHYQMSYKDTFLLCNGEKVHGYRWTCFSQGVFPIYILVECSNNLYISRVLRVDCYI